ncbi:MAG: hypothetical protein ABGX27_07615 [Desulfurobacteriaceae bacterium]
MHLLFVVLFVFATTLTSFAETGWIEYKGRNSIYYKPFVDVKGADEDTLVLFVTQDGRVYKGRCKKYSFRSKNGCRITPGKRFLTYTDPVLYIVIKLRTFSSPKLLKSGEVDTLNVKKRR